MESVHEDVQNYYGKVLKTSSDLQTDACCTKSSKKSSAKVKDVLSKIHEDVIKKYYGCGLVFPEAVHSCKIVDLGCGAGRDCFVLSELVGPSGFVIGIDFTKEQIEVAESFIQHHTTLWGYVHPNVSFINGNIERLNDCGINESTIDIIISNCVINLCPNKANVLRGAYDILKFGGEVYFSDVYTDKAMSLEVKSNKVLHGECIAGALVWKELMDMAVKIGFAPPVLVDVAPLNVNNRELIEILGDNKFCSATYRLFKLEVNATTPAAPSSVIIQYKGTIEDFPNQFQLSYDIILPTNSSVILPSSVAQLLEKSRFSSHFNFTPTDEVSSYAELSDLTNINPFDVIDVLKKSDENKPGCPSTTTTTTTKCCC